MDSDNFTTLQASSNSNAVFDVVERFVWTAVQAFFGSLPFTISLAPSDLKAVGYSGLTAALSAVISLAKNLTANKVTTP